MKKKLSGYQSVCLAFPAAFQFPLSSLPDCKGCFMSLGPTIISHSVWKTYLSKIKYFFPISIFGSLVIDFNITDLDTFLTEV